MRSFDPARWALLRERAGSGPGDRDRIVIEGVRFVVAAADHGATFDELAISPPLLRNAVGQIVARRLRRAGVITHAIEPGAFRDAFPDREPQGIAAIVRRPLETARAIGRSSGELWVAIESVRAPGNLGTAMRTAAAAGATGFVALRGEGGAIDLRAPHVVRASMGAAISLRLIEAALPEVVAIARRRGVRVVGATPDGARDYREIDWRGATILVVGAERGGLDARQRRACDELVRIPMARRIDSLNLAVATSILLYQAYAERHPAIRSPPCAPDATRG